MTDKKNWNVLLDRKAEKEFVRLPQNTRKGFYKAFELLENDPYTPRSGCDIRVIKGFSGTRAIRVGNYRGIYQIIIKKREVRFTTFAHRRSVYKR